MTAETVGTAVGCAVGIPIGVGIIVAFVFWYRMQRRFKHEMEHDAASNYDEEMSVNALGTMKIREEAHTTHVSSDETASLSEEKRGRDLESQQRSESQSQSTNGTHADVNDKKQNKRTVYTPAYRKRLQETVSAINRPPTDSDGNNFKSSTTSITSVDTPKKQNSQTNIFDQMIPVLPDARDTAVGSGSIFNEENAPNRTESNETLLKTIQGFDTGAYPRRASYTQISNMSSSMNNITNNKNSNSNLALSSRQSVTSLHTHMSSSNSLNSKSASAVENVFETPKSSKVSPFPQDSEPSEQNQYRLQNNYDIRDNFHIAEEDQYENEFTNYSENKREFIASLRPKNDLARDN